MRARERTRGRSPATALVILLAALISATGFASDPAEAQSCPIEERSAPTRFPVSFPRALPCDDRGGDRCDICERLAEQLAVGCRANAPAESPYADTVFRRQKLVLAVSENDRRAIIAAQISQDAATALELTATARASADPAARFLANTVSAFVIARAGLANHRETFDRIVRALREDSEVVAAPASDVFYLESLSFLEDGELARADAALEQALAIEPSFFHAAALRTRIHAHQAAAQEKLSRQSCQRGYDRLFESMATLMDLRPCPKQAAHVEVFLQRAFRRPEDEAVLSAAAVYLGVLARQTSYVDEALSRFRLQAQFSCAGSVLSTLEDIAE